MSIYTFNTQAEQFSARNGQDCRVARWITEADASHDAEVLPMAVLRFTDGTILEAWPDEISPAPIVPVQER